MSTYREIHGKAVKSLDTDPSATTDEGQIWYNTSSDTFKSIVSIEAFSSGSPTINAVSWMGSCGTKSAALIFSGSLNPYPTFTNACEEYDGTGWASATNYPLSKIGTVGCGTQTAGLGFGGGPYVVTTNEYDGSSWTGGGDMATPSRDRGPAGIQTAALGMTAYQPGSQGVGTSESYNGTAWTGITSAGTARYYGAGLGVQTAAIVAGGVNPPTQGLNAVEEWNGSGWTTLTVLPGERVKGQGAGTVTAGTVLGGAQPPYHPLYTASNTKLDYDGTSWAVSPATLSTVRKFFGGDGSSTTVYCAAGQNTNSAAAITNTEEFNVSANVITAAAWASGGAYPINVLDFSGAGTTTASIAFGGRNYPGPNGPTAVSATYDGSSWTGGPSLTSARQLAASAKNGTTTAALCTGGYTTTVVNLCEEFNGSSWAEGPNYPTTAQFGDQGVGIQTAALIAGGYGGGPGSAYLDGTSTYDGSSWTALSAPSNLQDSRFGSTTTGTSTAALMMAGVGGAGKVESWNGSAWSEQTEAITARTQAGSSGTSTDALYFGGEDSPTATAVTEHWNGTSWATRPNMGTASRQLASSGASSTSALAIGGSASPGNLTEEYTGETTAVNVKTLTQS